MKKVLLSLLLINCFLSSQAQLAADSIEYLVKREVEQKRSLGMVVGILTKKGSHVFGYGIVKDGSNIQPDGNTVYEIGSISKVFTSLLLADMVLKKELNLDDPISRFLPDTVKSPVRNGKEISLLDLSAQRSGLPRLPANMHPKDITNPYADYTLEQMYAFLSTYQLTRDIGSKYEYSNFGVGLLGQILCRAAGKDYETLLRERITTPLHMNSTSIALSSYQQQLLATGHDEKGKAFPNWDLPTFAGAGAIRSNVNDLLLFAKANLGLSKTKLNKAMFFEQEPRDTTGNPQLTIAMGWHILKRFGNPIIWHNGGTGGYRTFIGLDQVKKIGVVILSSSANSVDDIALHILNQQYPVNAFHAKNN